MRLKDLREDRDITQKEVALFLSIRQNTYSQYETQTHQIPLELLMKLADYYGTSVDYLLERTDEPRPYPKSRRGLARR